MKKQAADQQFHDRRYQERKRAEAVKKTANKQAGRDGATQVPLDKGLDEGSRKG